MDIDGQTDEDETINRTRNRTSDENDPSSPSMSKFISQKTLKTRTAQRTFQSDHSNSLSDTNESNIDSDASIDDDDDDLPTVLTDEELRIKLIYIYKRFTSKSIHDLKIFASFFKRHDLIDTSTLSASKSTDGSFTYDLFSLSPVLIGELANDLGYSSNNNINQSEQ